ncbi:hypothetical protein [Oceanobacter sp. 3_MG-2023]|uniref:hypothetical protein n=1 Tax=Oceanobacter sp. 3_MG-2023 TaxID=3062622 RepID=UPI002736C1D4|nr:hypothetical protein [Oceanobacter sp. 3_MG-2023]MDP2505636.1 hypothetical protein [Oceanobacter sp. 3_MG-2023]
MNEDLKFEIESLVEEARDGVQRLRDLQSEVARASLIKKAGLAEQAASESLTVLDSLVEAVGTMLGGLASE